jgi:hypothetical protein
MKLALYIVGGFLLWLGGYSYLKTRRSAGMRPTGALEGFYSFFGVCAELLAIPYLVAMAFVFEWWIVLLFFVVGGLLVGVVYERIIVAAAALAILATPIGIAIAVAALLM